MFFAAKFAVPAMRIPARGLLLLWSLLGMGACLAPPETAEPAPPVPVPVTPTPTWIAVPTFTPTPVIRLVPSAPPGTPVPTPTPRSHRVVAGDTLIGIAYQYGVTVADLRTANHIRDDRLLQIGQVLTIPFIVPDTRVQGTPTPLAHAIVQASATEDGLGLSWIMGGVENRASVPVEQVRIVARLLDAAGAEVDRAMVLSLRHIVPPGAITPFMLQVGSGEVAGSQWELSVASSQPAHAGQYYLDLDVSALQVRPFVEWAVSVQGQVTNRGLASAHDVEVVVMAMNDAGQIIGVRVLRPVPTALAPGGAVPFAGTVFALGSEVAAVEAFAQAVTE